MTAARATLDGLVAAELAAPVPQEVRLFAAWLASGARKPPLGLLFYGSALRTGDLDGILDFYVVLDGLTDWAQGPLAAGANRILPPNVEYHEAEIGGRTLRAKVAILSLRQFGRLARPESLDNSIWARFSQPVALVFARDGEAGRALAEAVSNAVGSAVAWALRLGPDEGHPGDYWRALFRRTYASELRVETAARPDAIVARAPERYEQMFLAACAAAGVVLDDMGDGRVRAAGRAGRGKDFEKAWSRRRRLGKPLNVARLVKAAFTFRNGADYLVWKIRRHTGIEIALSERQRRHPLLASGPVIWRLWRRRRASG